VCATFAVRRPADALAREKRLLDAAAAGDFYHSRAWTGSASTRRSRASSIPRARRGATVSGGKDDRARHELVVCELVERLPGLIDGGLGEFADLWKPALEELRASRAALAAADKSEVVHLDLCVWESARNAPFRAGPSRAVRRTRADRVLAIGRGNGGATYRFLLSTLSWFDLATPRTLPRPISRPCALD
jgi:hypothetical protein